MKNILRPKQHQLFKKILNEIGPNKLLRWQDSEKPNRILELVDLFIAEGIETENQLKIWLEDEEHIALLEKVRGVGNKTVDYLKLLSGMSTSAIDRHLLDFISEAGISVSGYSEAKAVINRAADLIGKEKSLLDHSIWKYMSEKKGKRAPTAEEFEEEVSQREPEATKERQEDFARYVAELREKLNKKTITPEQYRELIMSYKKSG